MNKTVAIQLPKALIGVIASPEGARQSKERIASSLSLLAMTQLLLKTELLHKTMLIIFFFILILSNRYVLANNEDISYNNEIIKRDPFIPLVDENGNFRNNFIKPKSETVTSTMLIPLSGISRINGVSYILIEGELFQEGDRYKGFKIEKITPEKAILSLRDKMYELSLEAQEKPKQK